MDWISRFGAAFQNKSYGTNSCLFASYYLGGKESKMWFEDIYIRERQPEALGLNLPSPGLLKAPLISRMPAQPFTLLSLFPWSWDPGQGFFNPFCPTENENSLLPDSPFYVPLACEPKGMHIWRSTPATLWGESSKMAAALKSGQDGLKEPFASLFTCMGGSQWVEQRVQASQSSFTS